MTYTRQVRLLNRIERRIAIARMIDVGDSPCSKIDLGSMGAI